MSHAQGASSRTRQAPTLHISKMSTFIEIASRVEAAVAAYTSVRDFADQETWRAQFRGESVSVQLHGLALL